MLRIRPYDSADLDSLYEISLTTGHVGGDATALYTDGRLMGHIYSAPYAVLAPELAFVVADDQGVAGFAVGTLDTETWFRRLEAEWWPRLRAQYEDPGEVLSPDWAPDRRRAFTIHHPVPTPQHVVERYPAHLHLNLAPRIQGRGLGGRLFREWRSAATSRGAGAFHIGTNRANERAIAFWSQQGFEILPPPTDKPDRTIWMGRSKPDDAIGRNAQ
jgi:GNAT superfamily N-acetyltransferase